MLNSVLRQWLQSDSLYKEAIISGRAKQNFSDKHAHYPLWVTYRIDMPKQLFAGISADEVGIRTAAVEKYIVAALQEGKRKAQLRTVAEC